MKAEYWILSLILIGGVIFSIMTRKLSPIAAGTGAVVGCLVFLGAGFTGITMLAVFFLLGSFATSWNMSRKEVLHLAEKNKGRRSAGQVLANGGVPALLGVINYLLPGNEVLLQVMMAAAFASATSDTLSSELGNVYGRKFFNVLSFKMDQRGLDGVISLEGTLFGVAGAMVIALVYSFGLGWSENFFWIIAGGTIGNFTDSLLGATLERNQYIGNNTVNFLNTLSGAISALVLLMLFN